MDEAGKETISFVNRLENKQKLLSFFLISVVLGVLTLLWGYELELLDDTRFQKGVAAGFANTYPNSLDEACISRWAGILPNYGEIKWMFWEITERFYFCENKTDNPQVTPDSIIYVSPNAGGKKLTINKPAGVVKMEYRTDWEWRGGCNLCKPWTFDGVTHYPLYGDPYTNWPHFLVGQVLSPSYVPNLYTINIPDNEKVFLTKYQSLSFHGEFKWNNSYKPNPSFNCPNGDWKPNTCAQEVCQTGCEYVPNHAIFYVGFVLWYKNWPSYPSKGPRVVYELLPLIYTENGEYNMGGDWENLMHDQYGDWTFFAKFGQGVTSNVRKLVKNQWISIDINPKQFSEYILNYIDPTLNFGDYFISMILIGWEIWGAYQTDIEFRNISFKAVPFVGDLDHDGLVNGKDAKILLLRYATNDVEADLYTDGKVNGLDFGKEKMNIR
jgi:hypothetical protein